MRWFGICRPRRDPSEMSVSPPRLLQLITLSEWGGAQQYVLSLARGLRSQYDVTVACAPGGPLIDRLHAEGIRVIEVPSLVRTPHPLLDFKALQFLVRLMRREQFDLVHCHSTKAGLLGRIAARMAGVRIVLFTAHGWQFVGDWPLPLRLAMIAAEWLAARLSTAIICVSDYDRQIALRMGIGAPDRLVVVHNGVDPAPWLGNGQAPPPANGPRPSTAVMVGRLTLQKDPVTLLDAWHRVDKPHRLIMVGDGPLLTDVKRQIERNGLSDRVALLDPTSDIPSLLRTADVFVQCSRWDGLPLAIIEAMMSGLPVVGTRVGGVAEVVGAGETGLLVPAQNPEALSSALNRLLHDPGLRARMGETGRRRALEHFTETRMIAETAEVYVRALRQTVRAARNP